MKNFLIVLFICTGIFTFGTDRNEEQIKLLQDELSLKIRNYQGILENGSIEAYKKLDSIQGEIKKLRSSIDKLKGSSAYEKVSEKISEDHREKLEKLISNTQKKLENAENGIFSFVKNKLKDKIEDSNNEFEKIEELLKSEDYEKVLVECDSILQISDNREEDVKSFTKLNSYKILALLKLGREEEADILVTSMIEEKRGLELEEIKNVLKDTVYAEDLTSILNQKSETEKMLNAKLNKYGKRKTIFNVINPFYHADNIRYHLKNKKDSKTTAQLVKKVYKDYAVAFQNYKANPSDVETKNTYYKMLTVYNSVKKFSVLQNTKNDRYDPEVFIFNDTLSVSEEEKAKSPFMRDDVQSFITKITKSNLLDGHYVEILKNGVEAFPKRFEMIEKAQKNVLCAALTYSSDNIGKKLADAMAEGVSAKGLRAIVLVDWVAKEFDDIAKKDWRNGFYESMRDRGIEVEIYNKIVPKFWTGIKRLHEKYFIVDGWYGITGGINIGDEYANGGITEDGWRDTDVYVEGPVVKLMEKTFMMNYEKMQKNQVFQKIDEEKSVNSELIEQVLSINDDERKDPEKNYDVMVRFISNKPTEKDTRIHDFYIALLENAERNVYIANPYFAPDDDFIQAMRDACARGVEVILLTNGPESQDVPFLGSACKYLYPDLIGAGVKLYEWQGTVMHQKVVSADGVTCAIGSYNLDSISRNHNSECVMNVLDVKIGTECTEMFLEDLKSGKRINSVEAQKIHQKVGQYLAHQIDYIL